MKQNSPSSGGPWLGACTPCPESPLCLGEGHCLSTWFPLILLWDRITGGSKKKLRSQRQTTANSVKELVCKDWGHNVSFFPVLQGIMDLLCLWKLRIMVHKSPVCPFPTFIVIELRKRKGGGRSSMEQILVSSLRHSSWPTMGTPISFKMWALIWPLSLSFTSQQVVVLFGKPLSLTSKPIFSAVLWAAVCGGHSWPAPPSRLSKLRTIVGTGRLEQGEETAHSC